MATVADPKPAAARVDAKLERELGRAVARIRANDLFTGAAALAVLTLGYALAGILIDRTIELPLWARQLGFTGFVAAFATVAYLGVVRPLRRMVNPRYAARQLEATVPGAKNAVINWVDLRDKPMSDPVRAAVGAKAAAGLADADVQKATESRSLLWLGGIAGALFALLAVQFVICKPAQFFSLLGRTLAPFSARAIASRTQITLLDPAAGDATVTVGDPLRVAISLGGRVPDPDGPDRPRLRFRHNPAAEYDELPMDRGETARDWSLRVPDHVIQNGFWYTVAAGDASTPEHRVDVRTRPLVKGFEARYEYPAYLRMKPETGREPLLEGYRGTQVTLTVRTNRQVGAGRLTVAGVPAPVLGRAVGTAKDALEFKLTLHQDTTYRVAFTAATGEYSDPTPPYPIRVLPDLAPNVQVTTPTEETLTLPANGLLKIDGTVGDDFGIDKVTLRLWAEVNGQGVKLSPKPYQDGKSFRRESDGSFPTALEYKDSVPLADLLDDAGRPAKLPAGATVEFWLEAADNCTVPGPNVGKSKVFKVKLGPPTTEPEQQAQQKKDEATRKADEKEHAKAQDDKFRTEKRDAPQRRPDATEPQPQDPAAKPQEGQSNGEPQKGGEAGKGGEQQPGGKGGEDQKPPMGANDPKPNGEAMSDPSGKPQPGEKPQDSAKPQPGGKDQPGANQDQQIQDEAQKIQDEIQKEQGQPGQARGGDDAGGKGQPEDAKPADPKGGEPKSGADAAEPKGGEKPDAGQPKGGGSGDSKGAGKVEPPADPAAAKPEPGKGDSPKPEDKASGDTPKNDPVGGLPGNEKPGEPEKKPDAGQGQPKPEDGGEPRGKPDSQESGKPQPGESKKPAEPTRGEEKAGGEKPAGDNQPAGERPAGAKGDKPTPGGNSKPQPVGEQKPNPADTKPNPDGPGQPTAGGQDSASAKPDGQPQPGGGKPGTGEEKPSNQWPNKKPEPGELSRETGPQGDPNGVPQPKDDVERLNRKRDDLASADEQKRKDAEREFDDLLGKKQREELQKSVKDSKEGGDPQKQKAAGEKADELTKKAAKNEAKNRPSKEDIDRAKQKAEDLASDDPAKRQAAEKEFDDAVGKDRREQLQQAMKDAKNGNGDPQKRQTAGEKADELTKKAARNAKNQPSAEDVKKLADKANDLASDDPQKRDAAEKEFDNAVGKENREKLQQAAKDAKSGDPAKQKQARESLDRMAKDAAKEQAKAGDEAAGEPKNGGTDTAGNDPKPMGGQNGPSKEETDRLADKAKDLASKDEAKRKAAEKEFDEKFGKDAREQMQKTAEDLASGDPERQKAALDRVREQMAKQQPPADKPGDRDTPEGRLGGTPPAGPDGKPLDDDPKNRLRTAELQLQQFEKNRYNAELQKKLGYTPEEYERFLNGFRDMVNRQREEVEAAAKSPEPPQPAGSPTLRVGEGGRVEGRPDAAVPAITGAGPSAAPPGYTDAQRRFNEEVLKLRRQK